MYLSLSLRYPRNLRVSDVLQQRLTLKMVL
jgi:hypothetical protein